MVGLHPLILQEALYHLHEEAPAFSSASGEQLSPGRVWRVCVIREGWSKNGRYYPREALKKAVPLFEGAAVAYYRCTTDGKANHLERIGRPTGEAPAGNSAGFTANCSFDESGPVGPGIYADYHCTWDQMRETAMAAHRANVPCPLGLSIDANGMGEMGLAEGRSGLIVHEITEILETTLVTNPAAGGRFVRLIASTGSKEEENMNALRRFLELRLRRTNGPADSVPGLDQKALCEAVHTQLVEMGGDQAILGLALDFLKAGKTEEAVMALEKLVAATPEAPEMDPMGEGAPPMKKKAVPAMEAAGNYATVDQVLALSKDLQEERSQRELDRCQYALRESLNASGLPEGVRSFVNKQFAGKKFTNMELAEAITDARNMLAKELPQTGIESGGRTSVGLEPYDRLAAAIDCMWTGAIPEGLQESEAHRQAMRGNAPSIRQICTEWYDDPNCVGRPGRNRVLVEATTADLPYLIGTSMNRRVAMEFTAPEREYERWVNIVNGVVDFKLQEILIEGSLGPLPTVAQGDGIGTATYSYGVLGGEDRVTASITKYGRVWGLTRELIKNDDMRWLRNLPGKIAQAGLLTEKTQVLKALVGNLGGGGINTDTAFTGNVLYSIGHNNFGSTAFSYAALIAALKRKRQTKQRGAKTTITSNINNSTTTIPVGSTSGFVAGHKFAIDGEMFTVASVDSAVQFTSTTRTAANGAASHTSGAAVRQFLDQVSLREHTLVVPTDLVDVAAEVLASVLKPDTANNNGSALPYMTGGNFQLQDYDASFLGNSATNFYLPVSAKEGQFIELAHMDGQRTPYVGVAEGQEAFNMLHADQTDFKTRFEFYVKQVMPDGSDGNIVT